MSLRSRASAALLALSLLAACDRHPAGPGVLDPALSGMPASPPGREDAGMLSFTYTGDEDGRYFALGEPEGRSGSTPVGDNFAAATHYVLGAQNRQPMGTVVTSSDRAGAGLEDLIHIQFPGPPRTGTYTLASCGRGGAFCPVINLVFGVDDRVDGGGDAARYYGFTRGSITITSVRDGRITGTFSGTAVQSWPYDGTTRQITITDGRFDVPVREWDLSSGG